MQSLFNARNFSLPPFGLIFVLSVAKTPIFGIFWHAVEYLSDFSGVVGQIIANLGEFSGETTHTSGIEAAKR